MVELQPIYLLSPSFLNILAIVCPVSVAKTYLFSSLFMLNLWAGFIKLFPIINLEINILELIGEYDIALIPGNT